MLTPEQIKLLDAPLDSKKVKKRPDTKMSYLEGWLVESEANRVFNYIWDSEVVELVENTSPTKNHNGNHVVSFRAKVRVSTHGIIKEGIGYGSGISKDIHAAYEGAIKEAETDAEKRAFKKFGNIFGLALYDKLQANVEDVKPEPTPEEKKEAAQKKADEIKSEFKACKDFNALEAARKKYKKILDALELRYPDLSGDINTICAHVVGNFDKKGE